MGKNLTDLQVSQFQETGFLPAFPVLSADHALHLRANLESFEAENDGVLTGSLRFKNHLLFKWLSDLIRSPRILDVVEDIICLAVTSALIWPMKKPIITTIC